MASFTYNDINCLDWRLMQNGAVVMYYRLAVLHNDIIWLRDHGCRVLDFDCFKWPSIQDFYCDVYAALGLPKPVNGNLDAMSDHFSDLEVPANGGCVIVFRRYDDFAAKNRSFAETVLDIVATQSRFKLLLGERFFAMIQSDDPQICFAPVGAAPILWNPLEWPDSKRGV
jgi:hypothetical protein